MDTRKIALLVGILCGAWCASALAGAEEKAASSDADTTPTAAASKTYIESGPFGFLKIEIPTPGRVRRQEPGESEKESENEHVRFCVLPLLEFSAARKGPGGFLHVAALKIPLAEIWAVTDKGKPFVPDDDWNPFWPAAPKSHPNTAFLDQPLFCLYDTVRLDKGSHRFDDPSRWSASRSRWLDTPLVSLWEIEKWGNGKYYRWKFVDFLPLAAVRCEKSRTQFAVRILDAPDTGLITGFRYHKDGKKRETLFLTALDGGVLGIRRNEKERETYFLSTFLASVWESAESEGEKEWSFLAPPLCGVVAGSAKGEKTRLTVLGTENVDSKCRGRGGAPGIALWHQNREDKDTSSLQFLRLPLLGPVWAAWENKEESHWSVFPRLLFWKKFKY